jgi:hypothetical protein
VDSSGVGGFFIVFLKEGTLFFVIVSSFVHGDADDIKDIPKKYNSKYLKNG